ncbi:MAG: hypothetical protein IT373_19790 [Polyangiaceae bacterium]|nr:hypothetical protein [Polyangiaceae bacterium]
MTLDVERLSNRLAAAPACFLSPVDARLTGSVDVAAIVADLFRDRATRAAEPAELEAVRMAAALGGDARKAARRHLGVALVAAWLLHDEAFAGTDAGKLAALLAGRLGELAALVVPRAFVEDPDRREELVRVCLDALGLAPDHELSADAEDRLATLDSTKRARLLADARAREQTREAERKKKLEELKRREDEERLQAARTTFED